MAQSYHVDRGDGVRLAAVHTAGSGPTLVFLPGYMSDMAGTKALFLEQWAAARGRAMLRLDYSGCGRSEGAFDKGSIPRWTADALAVIETVAPGPLMLVGSSMGGWIMLHLALALRQRVQALVGIAAAPDFTRWGLKLSDLDRALLAARGAIERPSRYGPLPYRYTRQFLVDSEAACLLESGIALDCPVRLLHGLEDPDVPWDISIRLAQALRSSDVQAILVKGGDHRLSSSAQLALLARTIECL